MNRFTKLLICAVLILVSVYIGGRYYFSSHFYPNTTVDGVEADFRTAEQVLYDVEENQLSKTIEVHVQDQSFRLGYRHASVLSNKEDVIAHLSTRDVNYWPYECTQLHHIRSGSDFRADENELKKEMNREGLLSFSIEPENAYISDFSERDGYTIVQDRPGWKASPSDAIKIIADAINNNEEKIDISEEFRVEADIRKNDKNLMKRASILNRITEKNITFSLADQDITLSRPEIVSWIQETEAGEIGIDKEKLDAWCEKTKEEFLPVVQQEETERKQRYILNFKVLRMMTCEALHISPETEEENKTLLYIEETGTKPEEKEIIDEEAWIERSKTLTDGLFITNADPEAAHDTNLMDTFPVPLIQAAPGFNEDLDSLDYIEVDIARQHVTVFKDAEVIMESDCVTGLPRNGRSTHKGVFKIDYKQRNRILRGSQRLYASFVNYWMPFDGGIGLHDATWRSSFGGEIYKSSGSHGCVNLPLSFAKQLYNTCYTGEIVWVH